MNDLENEIPTLTKIVQQGDETMFNHFNAHSFDADNQSSEKASNSEDSKPELNELNLDSDNIDIPSISVKTSPEMELPTDDFSDAMQISGLSSLATKNNEELKEKINQAISDVLPEIETRLRQQLYKNLNIDD